MDWTRGEQSGDIDDHRDESGGGSGFGGGGGGFGFGGIHLGIGGTLVLLILGFFFHTNLLQVFSGSPAESAAPSQPNTSLDAQEAPEKDFMEFVVKDVQTNWDKILPAQAHVPYRHARVELYRDSYPSACGTAQSAVGPFYCPEDQKVYLDFGFFHELKTRFGASGEFAQAYVVAHELGHHVQKLLGIEGQIHRAQEQDPNSQNRLSVQLELQADCLAGVWGYTTEQRNIVHPEDIQSGLGAAAAVGDDRIQKAARGYVNPDSFTHGSAAQRTAAFKRGLDTGQISACGISVR